MSKVNLLSPLAVKRLKCPKGIKEKVFLDGLGLYIRVRPDGSKYWLMKLYRGDKLYPRGVGSFPEVSIQEARKIRDEYRKLWNEGKDPKVENKKRKFQSVTNLNQTFEHVQEQTFNNIIVKLSDSHQKRWRGLYKNYLKQSIGSLPLSEIDDAIVLEVVEKVFKKFPQTGTKVKNLVSVVFNYAIEKKWFRGINPTKLLSGNSLIKKPKNTHMKYLEEHRVGELMVMLGNNGNPVKNALIYILMVTGLRVGSLINAKWSWVHGETLVIPKEFMKNRQKFRCPLPKQALNELQKLKKESHATRLTDYIFPSPTINDQPLRDTTSRVYFQELFGENYTLHGFRTLFNRVVTKSRKFEIELIESQLTHAYTQTSIRRVYLGEEDWLEERRKIIQYYADWVDDQIPVFKEANRVR